MSKGLVTCRACRYFRQGRGSREAFGLCKGKPWDHFQGQWPDKRHPCGHFMPADPAPPAKGV